MFKILTSILMTSWLSLGFASSHIMKLPNELSWTDGPPTLPAGAKIVVLDGDPGKKGTFTMRLKFPANYRIPPHWHFKDENISVIQGELHMGSGAKVDATTEHVLPTGSYAVMPMKFNHYAFTTDQETIVQLHGMGPFDITYLNAKDDPRKMKK
jgi:Domain of unknown function (DUF4437)